MTDLLIQMKRASWRGIEFPVMDTRDFGFKQDQEEHRFIFRDEQLIESLGAGNPTYRYIIPFREDIAKGGWKNLFTKVYPNFLVACRDRSNGILNDPAHGQVQCKVVSFEETLDVHRRDGVDVHAEFIVSPDENENAALNAALSISTLQGAQNISGFMDREATKLDDATKKAIADLNKGSGNAKLDPLSAATSALNQVEAAGNKFVASIGDVAFKAQKLDDSLRRLERPDLAPLRANARALALAAFDLAKLGIGRKSGSTRPIRVFTAPYQTTRIAIASQLGMGLADFIKLNPDIGRTPVVEQGRQVLYYG